MNNPSVEPLYSVEIPVGDKACLVAVLRNNTLRLYVANCLRKQCNLTDGSPILYAATNVELYWEEHRFVEVRYNTKKRTLHVWVNHDSVFAGIVP